MHGSFRIVRSAGSLRISIEIVRGSEAPASGLQSRPASDPMGASYARADSACAEEARPQTSAPNPLFPGERKENQEAWVAYDVGIASLDDETG